ncbi:MAG: cytochrome b [Micavibrio sp.]
MIWRNTTEKYGAVAIGFHWLMAILVITLLVVGLVMTEMDPSPQMFKIYATHKSVGIVVLALAVLRVLWRIANPHPRALPTHQAWEKFLARLVHVILYAALFVMPLSGWIMSSAKGFPVNLFWIEGLTLPDLVKPDEGIADLAKEIHEVAAFGLMGAIALHFGGAMKHHLIDRDGTLRRMLPCPCAKSSKGE